MKKAKKGFMQGSPKRKDKLRKIIRTIFRSAPDQATEDRRRAAERKHTIEERCGKPKDVRNADEEELKIILKQYHARILDLESEKYEIEYDIFRKQRQCDVIGYEVNARPGKYVKPPLKRVPKYSKQVVEFQERVSN